MTYPQAMQDTLGALSYNSQRKPLQIKIRYLVMELRAHSFLECMLDRGKSVPAT